MKNLKKIRKCKCKNSEKNKVWGLTQEISVVSNESNRKCKRSGDLKRKLTYADGRTPDKSVSDKLRLTKVSRSQKREPSPRTCVEGTASSPLSPPPPPHPLFLQNHHHHHHHHHVAQGQGQVWVRKVWQSFPPYRTVNWNGYIIRPTLLTCYYTKLYYVIYLNMIILGKHFHHDVGPEFP